MHIIQALTTISDPRRRSCPLSGLLTIVLRAAMHGEQSLRGMWFWARARQDDLRTHPALGVRAVRRIPRRATFGSAGRNTPAGERERAPVPLLLAERDLALDGTRRRGSTRDATDALRIVTRAGETVGQVWTHRAVPDGDEVAAVPALPETFLLGRQGHRRRRGLRRPPFVQNAVEKKGLYRADHAQPARPPSGPRARERDAERTGAGWRRRSNATGRSRAGRRGWRCAATSASIWCGWIARTRWRAGREETRCHGWMASTAFSWSLDPNAHLTMALSSAISR